MNDITDAPVSPDVAAPAAATTAPPADSGNAPPKAEAKAGGADILDTQPVDGAKDTTADDVLSGDDDVQPEGVPEEYTFELSDEAKAAGLEISDDLLGAFKGKAKDLGFTQDQFQGVLEYYAERTQASTEEAVNAWNDRVQGWRDSARTDKDFGGEHYDANVTTALTAVEKFGDAEFKALLKSPSEQNPSGLAIGNHPALLRTFNRIGKALGDPSLLQGDSVTQSATDEARMKRLYPSMFKD